MKIEGYDTKDLTFHGTMTLTDWWFATGHLVVEVFSVPGTNIAFQVDKRTMAYRKAEGAYRAKFGDWIDILEVN